MRSRFTTQLCRRPQLHRVLATASFLLVSSALAITLLIAQGPADSEKDASSTRPDGKGVGTIFYAPHGRGGPEDKPSASSPGAGNGIAYHGGPVMTGMTNVYYIWYGNWPNAGAANSAQTLLNNLALHIAPTSYFNIETTYYQGSGTMEVPAKNSATFGGSYFVTAYPAGSATYAKKLSDNDVLSIVSSTLTGKYLPTDPNGVYFVLTSADVGETSGFCSQYCAWHWSTDANQTAPINGVDVKYSFVGNPDRCPSSCEAQTKSSPNNNPGVDAMADSIAHELEESVNDPDGNAWYDRRGNESADKCAWTYGTTGLAANGSHYNLTLGGVRYLIQQNWVNANGGYCALQYP